MHYLWISGMLPQLPPTCGSFLNTICFEMFILWNDSSQYNFLLVRGDVVTHLIIYLLHLVIFLYSSNQCVMTIAKQSHPTFPPKVGCDRLVSEPLVIENQEWIVLDYNLSVRIQLTTQDPYAFYTFCFCYSHASFLSIKLYLSVVLLLLPHLYPKP